MNMWENGFSIDDGPLRTFTDPENQDFLRNITQGYGIDSFVLSRTCLFSR